MHTRSDPTSSRPVVALMGEFSAGKSTLANLLIGLGVSPVRVTATQLPPIWYSYGAPGAECVDCEGATRPVELDEIDGVSLEDAAYLRVYLDADVLELMDIVDMPGISDPNLSSKTWEQILPHADSVIWCSHATQAWRQSEAAAWSDIPAFLHETSLLLLTRFDKLLTESDRRRVVSRVETETAGQFAGVYPISLLQAVEAEDDRKAWEDSGAEAFTQRLLDVVFSIPPREKDALLPPFMRIEEDAILLEHPREPMTGRRQDDAVLAPAPAPVIAAGVTPRRIAPTSQKASQRERLPRSALSPRSV